MTEFGQSSPATPQAYVDAGTYVFTKAGFLSHMVRALQTVGMVPLAGLWPYDPVANPEQIAVDSQVPLLFPFDYPDASTFSVNNALWRPCVVVAIFQGDFLATTPASEYFNDAVIFDAIRTDGDAHLDSIYITNRHRNPVAPNFGFSSGATTTAPRYGYDHGGAVVSLTNWKPFASHAGAFNVNELTVKNWFVYLGRAGLFVYVGSGPSQAQFGSHLACGYVFGGGRIAGRELTVDVNLNRINPIIPLYLRSTSTVSSGTGQWLTDLADSTKDFYETSVHGLQFDLKSQLLPVRAGLYNLENVEYPLFPFYKPWTAPSPREIAGGSGAHILGRLVMAPAAREDNAGDLYGPLVNSLSTSQPRPQWGEVFTAPGFRWSDLAAPLGLNEDPVTLIDWFIVPTYNSNSLIGLYYENAVVVSALASLIKTLAGDDFYTTAGTPGFNFGSLGGGLSAPVVTVTTTAATWEQWDDSNALDLVFAFNDPAYAGAAASTTMEWVVTPPAADASNVLYEIEFDARNRDDVSTEGNCPIVFETLINGIWTEQLSLNSAGANTGLPAFNFVTYVFSVPIDSVQVATRTLKFRWRFERLNATTEGNTATVQNVHIKKYTYV